jgi:hypothetical protein
MITKYLESDEDKQVVYTTIGILSIILMINIGLSSTVIQQYNNALKTADKDFEEVANKNKNKIKEVFKKAIVCLFGSLFVLISFIIIILINYYKFKGDIIETINYYEKSQFIIIIIGFLGLLGLIVLITFILSLILIYNILFGVLHTHFFSYNINQFLFICCIFFIYACSFIPVIIFGAMVVIPFILGFIFTLFANKFEKNK